MTQLNRIPTFLRCAELGSFSKAAIDLGMTPQAVSSQIKQLEQIVGVRLFHRTTRKIGLTEEGARFFEQCRRGMQHIDEGFRTLREAHDEVVGTVRLAVPFAVGRNTVVPLLASFLKQYPRVSIELIVQNETPDVVDQGVDLGVATGYMPSEAMTARRLGAAELILCASPDYLAERGVPESVDDLHRHRCVSLRHPRTGKIMPWSFRQGDQVVTLDMHACLTTNDTDTQRQAVLQGAGIGQLASFFIASHLRAGRLRPLLLGYAAPPIPFYVYLPRRENIPRKTRVLADFLYEAFRKNPDFEPLDLGRAEEVA
jgi:DNA-binding transcriptional LysR family regulator